MFTGVFRNTIDAARVCGCPSCRYRANVLSEEVLSRLSFDLAEAAANLPPITFGKNG
jgi:hypothetical protein